MTALDCRPSDAAREGNFATVIVGTENTDFKVHKALLTHYSEYFARSFNGRWAEAETGIVRLKEVDCHTFEMFVNWIYSQNLPDWHDVAPNDCDCHDDAYDKKLCTIRKADLCWTKAYCFADRFQAVKFKAVVCAEYLHQELDSNNIGAPFFSVINYAFANLREDDILLRLLVDKHCLRYKPESDKDEEIKDRDQMPNAFVVRMMHRYSTVISQNVTRRKLKAEDYQLHDAVLDG